MTEHPSHEGGHLSVRPNRDLRIDFARGAALLIIFSDHIQGNPLAQITPYTTCYFDMSEVFIFLSGYVCGISYYRTLTTRGFLQCQIKATRRWLQIYAAHVLTLLVHLAILFAVSHVVMRATQMTFENYSAFEEAPIQFVLRILTLRQRVAYFDILPVYLAILPFLPAGLYLRSMASWALPLVSIGIYLQTTLLRLDLMLLPGWPWSFQPLAWQILFFGGAYLATAPAARNRLLPTSATATILAVILFCVLFVLRLSEVFELPFTTRKLLEPIRLIHFWSAVVIARNLIFPLVAPETRAASRPIVVCGQNSLVTYCVGGIIANLAMLWPRPENNVLWWSVGLNALGWIGCIAAAYFSAWIYSRYVGPAKNS